MPSNVNINTKTIGSKLKPVLEVMSPGREYIPTQGINGISYTLNPDYGVDKLLNILLPLFPSDCEFVSELIIKEHRKNPNIGFNELYIIVQKGLEQKQIGMTTGLRAQVMPGNFDVVSNLSRNSILDFIQQKIAKALRDYAQYDLKKVDKINKDGVRIIYEGQKTINGISVDIDSKGNPLVKAAVSIKPAIPPTKNPSAILGPDIPPTPSALLRPDITEAIDNMFRLCPDEKPAAYSIAMNALKKNPSALLEDICMAIKHEMH